MSAQRETKSGNSSLKFSSKDAKVTRAAGSKITQSALKSKESAQAYLVELGVSKRDGTLTKKYGGK